MEGAAPWAAPSASKSDARPAIGARVRVGDETGIPGVAGRLGIVAAHHVDGIAIIVRLDVGGRIVCEPDDVTVDRGAPPYTPTSPSPARIGGSAT